MMYAVIDIETTGISARLERITEIAIYIYDGTRIINEYSTLINPERLIPHHITVITGITNEMVEEAPRFYEVAAKVIELTEGNIFVAHNASFDYSFIRQEFSMLGYKFRRPLLDTVSWSRKLLPGHRSYSLGNLCNDLGITINDRHRASGDALATVRLLELLLQKDEAASIHDLNKERERVNLHPSLDTSKLTDIPEGPGVYYFYDGDGQVIYISRCNNLNRKVNRYFSGKTHESGTEMLPLIADVSWETTGSELIALLIESRERKNLNPRFNKSHGKNSFNWGIFSYTDENGYIRFEYRNITNNEEPLSLFSSRDKAGDKIKQIINRYELCQKLCGMYNSPGPCFHRQVGICHGACCGEEETALYNERAQMAFNDLIAEERNFFIIDRGRENDERSVIKIENGRYTGYGYINVNDIGFGLTDLHDCIKKAADNNDLQAAIKSYLKNHNVEKIIDF